MKHYEGDEFPVHIDLGVKRPDYAIVSPDGNGSKKSKKDKMDYPTLYIRGVKGLDSLPEDGCALIEFHRNKISTDTPEGEDGGESTELSIKVLCLPDDSGESDGEDLKSAMAKAMKGSGVDTEGYEGEEDDSDDEGNEEGPA